MMAVKVDNREIFVKLVHQSFILLFFFFLALDLFLIGLCHDSLLFIIRVK